jgi:hypothetical protein
MATIFDIIWKLEKLHLIDNLQWLLVWRFLETETYYIKNTFNMLKSMALMVWFNKTLADFGQHTSITIVL